MACSETNHNKKNKTNTIPGKEYSISKRGRISVDLEEMISSDEFKKQLDLFEKIRNN